MPGLERNFSINVLLSLGFQIVYNQFYANSTNQTDLDNVKNQSNSSTVLCVGGGAINSDILELVSCAQSLLILSRTSLNIPKFIGSAYWYMIPGTSFGFSPTLSINQSSSDIHDPTDDFRLSWIIGQNRGGDRLGSRMDLRTSTSFRKYLFLKI